MTTNPNGLTPLDRAVAAEIAAEIRRQRRTVGAVAETLGLSRSHFSRQINGRYAFRLADLAAIASVLHLRTSDLIERAERETEHGATAA